jgi:hypothetical protein
MAAGTPNILLSGCKDEWNQNKFPTANLLGFSVWGQGSHENARPEKPEHSWNLAGTFRCWVTKLG